MIKIPRWDPFREVARIERDMRNMFDDFWGGRVRKEALPGPGKAQLPVRREEALVGTPTVDIVDKKDKLVLRSDMPVAKKKNIRISVEEDRIHISGNVEREEEEKKEDYYILQVTLPKAEEAKAKVNYIRIE